MPLAWYFYGSCGIMALYGILLVAMLLLELNRGKGATECKILTFAPLTSWKSRCCFPERLAASVRGQSTTDALSIYKCLLLLAPGHFLLLLLSFYNACMFSRRRSFFSPRSRDQCCSCFRNMNWLDSYEFKISRQRPRRFNDE